MSKEKDQSSPLKGPVGDDELQNEILNAKAAEKIKQAEVQVKEIAHDFERGVK
ncbi:hypothetical protein [Glutamicibacter sp.]|uniref:hypothetical protein n=1 Tax=Glutamicibacter sp. TaxID=1931995 RepID=UPI0028BDBC0A|nr:hypothetical protein [Glutamicibacter sp.]